MKVNIYFSNMIEFNFSKSRYKKEVLKLVDKRVLSRYISKRCGKNKVKINYNFVSTNEQINMNTELKECELTGDVYISLKQIRKNTKRYGVSLRDEVNRVLIHGFLHLYGYNDETKEERNIMRKQEDRYLDFMKRKCSTWNMSVNHY